MANKTRAADDQLKPIALHQCRHLLRDAGDRSRGPNPKRLQVMMGHADIKMTLGTYGFLYSEPSTTFGQDGRVLARHTGERSAALRLA